MTSRQAGARQVIFIIDTSGSMQGASIEQARAALRLGVARLRPGDRFNVIRFSDATTRLFQKPEDASAANIAAAGRFIDALSASGGTEMRPALQTGLRHSARRGCAAADHLHHRRLWVTKASS